MEEIKLYIITAISSTVWYIALYAICTPNLMYIYILNRMLTNAEIVRNGSANIVKTARRIDIRFKK